MDETVAIIICPKCGRTIILPRIYAPSIGEERRVAINHGDHAVIVGFDRFGVARSVSSIMLRTNNDKEGHEDLICPRCRGGLPMTNWGDVDRYAIDHGDHIVIVYRIGKEVDIEVIDKILPIRTPPRTSRLRKVIMNIGKEALASIILWMIKNPNREVKVPGNLHTDIKFFIEKLLNVRNPNIITGIPEIHENSKAIAFFIKKINYVENLSTLEAIQILKESIELIESIKESLIKIKRLYGREEACEYLNLLKESDQSLCYVIKEIITMKCDDERLRF